MSTPHLRRNASLVTLVTLIAMAVVTASPVRAASVTAQPVPPLSDAYGRSLAEWMKRYWTWYFQRDPQDGQVGPVQFLDLPEGVPVAGAGTYDDPVFLEGHLDVTLEPGTPFVLPVITWIGVDYLNGTQDQPLDESIFTDSNILVTLDGKPIIDSSTDDLSRYYYGPVDFDEPIAYQGVNLIWVQGIGFVHHPLSVGTHTITLHSELLIQEGVVIPEDGVGTVYDNTWTITVEPRAQN